MGVQEEPRAGLSQDTHLALLLSPWPHPPHPPQGARQVTVPSPPRASQDPGQPWENILEEDIPSPPKHPLMPSSPWSLLPGRSALTHSVVALEAGLCSWQPPVQASPVSRVSLPHLPQLREAYDSGPALSLVVWPSETQAPQDMCRTPWPHPAQSGLQVTAAPANVQQEPCEALCQLSGRPPVFTKRAAQPQPQP